VTAPTPEHALAPIRELRVGEIELAVLSDGRLRIPAERMTGAIPPEIASRYLTPDAAGDVWLGLNCVLLRMTDRLVLVDSGFGDGPLGDDPDLVRHGAGLTAMLARCGVDRHEIDLVVNTHLHADHAGGNLVWEAGVPQPAFPRAEYVVQAEELHWALAEDPRDAVLYAPDEIRTLAASGRLRTCDGEVLVAPGIRVWPAPGHSPGHQVVIVESAGERAILAGDLAPLRLHVEHPGWELPGDLDPAAAVRSRETVLGWAAEVGVPLVSYHEHDEPVLWIGGRP
jgi:glyoxylase-like metal-dependent hydrolase (beta-lactamase superfamily II)